MAWQTEGKYIILKENIGIAQYYSVFSVAFPVSLIKLNSREILKNKFHFYCLPQNTINKINSILLN
jgi:hypothetical protein